MRKLILLVLLFAAFWPLAAAEKVTWHEDRPTPKHIYQPMNGDVGEQSEAAARAYLAANKDRFMLEPDGLAFSHERTSLLGKHYTFNQTIQGIRVQGSQVVVTIDENGVVTKLSNNIHPVTKPLTRQPKYLLNEDDALDVAWNHMKVHGRLINVPKCEKVYVPVEDGFVLAYETMINTEAPMGAWKVMVDAVDGSVLSETDTNVYRKPLEREDFRQYDGIVANRAMETAEVTAHLQKQAQKAGASKRADGTGLVFDPDPRTTLADSSLEDFSPASAFENAYFLRTLRDLTIDGTTGEYELDGPYCVISQLSSPFTAASTTSDGNWTATRGDNAFNDAMTYYHIDQNQRYIQSLGFDDIQNRRMPVDTDALGGQDQSVFSSDSNGLQFGHGCVDDNEDADVILHEYGHSIQYAIDPNFLFDRGDHGGMGEGFGDYWATSYGLRTQNGRTFHPEWVFSWDGHGDTNDCWSGRVTNALSVQYNSNFSYGAHEPVRGVLADELWSTPLFQAALYLLNRGIPLDESDRIVLQGHYGLTGALKMPDVAQSMVDAARQLYPNGPHATAFQQSFARHNILEPVEFFTYYTAHVPPSRSAVDWQSEIQLSNPGQSSATVTATVYENTGSGFAAQSPTTLTIGPGETHTFVPSGSEQRWVRFDSTLPLSGTSLFSRNPQNELGAEKAGIPLFSETETGPSLIFPHVPADRQSFWSGAVIINPGDTAVTLDIDLYGENGNLLSDSLLTGAAKTSLAPGEKWVTFLAEGPGGVTGVFDDDTSGEKVSWVRVSTSGGNIAGFQLYGYNAADSELATAGIMALPDQQRTVWPLRVSLTGVDFAAFSVLNPEDAGQPVAVTVYGRDGSVMATATMIMEARRKVLGINLGTSGFLFPSDGSGLVLEDGSNVQMVTLQSTGKLRAFELSGDLGNTVIDGAAVTGVTSHVTFNNPRGVFELTQVDIAGDVTVTVYRGSDVQTASQPLAQGESLSIELVDPTITTLDVQGTAFTASVVERDAEGRTLTIVNGKQVEPVP